MFIIALLQFGSTYSMQLFNKLLPKHTQHIPQELQRLTKVLCFNVVFFVLSM